jgi:release factor glutamine methyltransferase
MASVLGCRPAELALLRDKFFSEGEVSLLENRVQERCERRPLAHVLGEWDFAGLRLAITRDVLVPRPETEGLWELVVSRLSRSSASAVELADVGTGSGCLAVALAKSLPPSVVWALDVSLQALEVAERNAEAYGVSERIRFQQGDLLSPLMSHKDLRLDAVVANLPYVDEKEMDQLPPEVRHEPALALNGGKEGLAIIRRLLPQAATLLKPGGGVFLEVGYDQAQRVARDMAEAGFVRVAVHKDFAGIDRFVAGENRGPDS